MYGKTRVGEGQMDGNAMTLCAVGMYSSRSGWMTGLWMRKFKCLNYNVWGLFYNEEKADGAVKRSAHSILVW